MYESEEEPPLTTNELESELMLGDLRRIIVHALLPVLGRTVSSSK